MRRPYLLLILISLMLCVPVYAADPATPPAAADKAAAAADTAAAPVIDEGGKVENPPETVELKYSFEKGLVSRYQVQTLNRGKYKLLNMKKEVALQTVTEMYFRQTVQDEKDGIFRILWELQSGTVSIPEFGQSVLTLPELTYSMDQRGAVQKVSGLDKLALLPGKPQQKSFALTLGQLRFQGFPNKPLKVGDQWVRYSDIELPNNEKTPVKITSKLIGYEHYDNYDCAKIESTYDYPVRFTIEDKDNGKLTLEGKESGSMIVRFAYKEGLMIRTEGDVKSEAKVLTADGKDSGAYAKLEINVASKLLPNKPGGDKEGQ